MARARIYQPAKTAMQSGRRNTQRWVLEYEPEAPRTVDPLMGWTSSSDMRQELRLTFAEKDQAVAFARRNKLDFEVVAPHQRKVRPKVYADNFRYDRVG